MSTGTQLFENWLHPGLTQQSLQLTSTQLQAGTQEALDISNSKYAALATEAANQLTQPQGQGYGHPKSHGDCVRLASEGYG